MLLPRAERSPKIFMKACCCHRGGRCRHSDCAGRCAVQAGAGRAGRGLGPGGRPLFLGQDAAGQLPHARGVYQAGAPPQSSFLIAPRQSIAATTFSFGKLGSVTTSTVGHNEAACRGQSHPWSIALFMRVPVMALSVIISSPSPVLLILRVPLS